jgi:hypothetical protein
MRQRLLRRQQKWQAVGSLMLMFFLSPDRRENLFYEAE